MINLIITCGIISTICMTLFSYALSYFTKGKFEEPQLINILLNKLPSIKLNLTNEHVLGWVIHVVIGILFVVCFQALLYFDLVEKATLIVGIIFGLCAGILGAFVWMLCFSLHPNPPEIDRTKYYLQLIPAHIIFGCTMITFYS